MEKLNGFWVDKNRNRWNCDLHTEDEAQNRSNTMIHCYDCVDCSHCSDCSYCSYCSNCSGCSGCSSCKGCSNCLDCSSCSRCSRCSRCKGCSGFESNPKRYTGDKIGSRSAQTTTYWTDNQNQVVCGCYTGTIDEFESRVKEVHGDTEHGQQYKNYIGIVRAIIEMEQNNE